MTACVALGSVNAGAIVPPTDCGKLTAKGKRYTIKADQIRCKTARSHSRRYLTTGTRPRGYRCRKYGRETKIKFRCSKGVRVFFAIRR
jgi:hypothetical protein